MASRKSVEKKAEVSENVPTRVKQKGEGVWGEERSKFGVEVRRAKVFRLTVFHRVIVDLGREGTLWDWSERRRGRTGFLGISDEAGGRTSRRVGVGRSAKRKAGWKETAGKNSKKKKKAPAEKKKKIVGKSITKCCGSNSWKKKLLRKVKKTDEDEELGGQILGKKGGQGK